MTLGKNTDTDQAAFLLLMLGCCFEGMSPEQKHQIIFEGLTSPKRHVQVLAKVRLNEMSSRFDLGPFALDNLGWAKITEYANDMGDSYRRDTCRGWLLTHMPDTLSLEELENWSNSSDPDLRALVDIRLGQKGKQVTGQHAGLAQQVIDAFAA